MKLNNELREIASKVIESGFSEEVIEQSIIEAEKVGADREFLDALRACFPIG